jgi:hypothetical protein
LRVARNNTIGFANSDTEAIDALSVSLSREQSRSIADCLRICVLVTRKGGKRCVSVSVVNGFLCYSSCDQTKAREGKDPHPKQDAGGDASNGVSGQQDSSKATGAPNDPAVTFGGALAGLNAVQPVDASSAAQGPNLYSQGTSVDILA